MRLTRSAVEAARMTCEEPVLVGAGGSDRIVTGCGVV